MAKGVFASTYGVELICRQRPEIPKPPLLRSLRKWCSPAVEPLDRDERAGLLTFVHPDHPIQLADARIAAQTFIASADKPVAAKAIGPALDQSWGFDQQSRAEVARCTGNVVVTDFMSSGLEYRERLDLFHRALRAVLEVVPCAAIHWQRSQRVVAAAGWVEAFDSSNPAQLLAAGAVNVRLFKVEGEDRAPGETLMDTLGLGALGLPDLQCHFARLDPSDVARVLYNTAVYIFDNGDVIHDGNTAQGIGAEDRWRCQHEDALAGPERVVLDMNPGPPYAAGDRTG